MQAPLPAAQTAELQAPGDVRNWRKSMAMRRPPLLLLAPPGLKWMFSLAMPTSCLS